ncbi:MAG: hypothetical protein ACD_9C00055G0001, partial [uncultured bacterium]
LTGFFCDRKGICLVGVINYMKFIKNNFPALILIAFVAMFSTFIFLNNREFKDVLVRGIKKIKNLVYYEATIHNPEGDMLPDNIDNSIISKVKDIF